MAKILFRELTDESPMPFGKYKGTPMSDVPANYLFWLWTEGGKENQTKTDPVAAYIKLNLDVLKTEYPDGIW